ncbi:MAG: PRC-barrel domain-containing protein [Solirubrobacteraceae bacterium]
MPQMTDAYEWQGRTLIGSDGEKIGKISQIYEDTATGQPEWATVSSGLFGNKSNFVPLAGASSDGDDVRAGVTKTQVKDAPGVDGDGQLSEPEERRLFEHYGIPYTTDGSTIAQVAPGTEQQRGAEPSGDGRSETDPEPAARERLRRYVVTETVVETGPVQREEVTIEREPVTDTNREVPEEVRDERFDRPDQPRR